MRPVLTPANVNITAPEVTSDSSYTLSVVVSDGKTSVQSNVQVNVAPKATPSFHLTKALRHLDEGTTPADEGTTPADEGTKPADEGTATGSCDTPVDANASQICCVGIQQSLQQWAIW